MRMTLIAMSVLALLTSSKSPEPLATVPFTITWKFANIVEGYDHSNKCEVYIDGALAGTSSVTLETQQNSMTVQVSPGKHAVRVVNYALYEGEWEEHTIANDYSIDCTFEELQDFDKKKSKLFLLFDIDEGTTSGWKKMPKVKKKKKGEA